MSPQSHEASEGQPPPPELIPPPPPVDNTKIPDGYKPASENIENINQLNLVDLVQPNICKIIIYPPAIH